MPGPAFTAASSALLPPNIRKASPSENAYNPDKRRREVWTFQREKQKLLTVMAQRKEEARVKREHDERELEE